MAFTHLYKLWKFVIAQTPVPPICALFPLAAPSSPTPAPLPRQPVLETLCPFQLCTLSGTHIRDYDFSGCGPCDYWKEVEEMRLDVSLEGQVELRQREVDEV